jgi:SNF2 family DNA or RNA helicase
MDDITPFSDEDAQPVSLLSFTYQPGKQPVVPPVVTSFQKSDSSSDDDDLPKSRMLGKKKKAFEQKMKSSAATAASGSDWISRTTTGEARRSDKAPPKKKTRLKRSDDEDDDDNDLDDFVVGDDEDDDKDVDEESRRGRRRTARKVVSEKMKTATKRGMSRANPKYESEEDLEDDGDESASSCNSSDDDERSAPTRRAITRAAASKAKGKIKENLTIENENEPDESHGLDEEEDDDEAELPKRKEESLKDEALSPAVLEIAKEAKCLKLLKPKDRKLFAKLWGKAHDISTKMQSYASNESASQIGSSVSHKLVTPQDLFKTLGWGITSSATIASSGSAGSDKQLLQRSEALAAAGVASSVDSSLTSVPTRPKLNLTPFQLVGLNWLLMLHREGVNGVLADEMGLGKSVQTLALLDWIRVDENSTGPHLIVTPASTLSNWVRECKKWTPHLRVRVYRGGADRFEQIRILTRDGPGMADEEDEDEFEENDETVIGSGTDDEADGEKEGRQDDDEMEEEEQEKEEFYDNEDDAIADADAIASRSGPQPRSFDILVTTYQIFDKQGGNAITDRALFRRFKWQYIICDEGHSLKKSDSQRFRTLTSLHTKHRLLLSGTPIQNSITELFSLLRFMKPDLFTRHVEKIFTGEKTGSSSKDRKLYLDDLRNVLLPFILRRAKSDVMKDLPPKVETVELIELPLVHAIANKGVQARTISKIVGGSIDAVGPSAPVVSDGPRQARASAVQASENIQTSMTVLGLDVDKKWKSKSATDQDSFSSSVLSKSETGQRMMVEATPSVETAAQPAEVIVVSDDPTDDEDAPIRAQKRQSFHTSSGQTGILSVTSLADTEKSHQTTLSVSTIDASTSSSIAQRPLWNKALTASQTESLRRASKKLDTKAINGIFGDLRKISQHPLMIQTFYSDTAVLKRLAQALFNAGAYGFQPGCTPERVFGELCELSDLDLWQLCLQTGFKEHKGDDADSARDLGVLPPGSTVATLCNSTSKQEDGIIPISLPPHLHGRALLRAAVQALPSWAHECSAKTSFLKSWLPAKIAEGHRILIFSQMMAILSILECCLGSWGIQYVRLDGSTPVDERQALLDRFNRDNSIGVFLLSTKAGGLGLNLVSADTVVIHDSDWNPHADAQAVDRAHRIGQTRTVQVVRLLSKGTLDEHMAKIAKEKLELDMALSGKTSSSSAIASPAKGKSLSKATLAEILSKTLEIAA